jgi:hypothetical protein
MRPSIATLISGPSYNTDFILKKYFTEKIHNIMKSRNGPQAKNWPSILGEPNFWSAGRVRPCLLNIKIFFQNIGLHSLCKGPQANFRISTNEKHGF